MSFVSAYGPLSDPSIQESLAKAQETPEVWTIYLVPGNGEKRTLAQNRLFHVLVSKLAQTLGGDVAYWNHRLVEMFLGYQDVLTEDGYTVKVLSSTSSLNVVEFSSFLNACLAWANEKGVV